MHPLSGGMIIGLAATIMLLFLGRVTGISGIISGILKTPSDDSGWRFSFLAGLLIGGGVLKLLIPSTFMIISNSSLYDYAIGGFLVGLGTVMGSGCTSGHGVCGISRLSLRSVIATITFIGFGIFSIILFRFLKGSL